MKTHRSSQRVLRGNPLLQDRVHDPYRARAKLREGTCCTQCGARFRKGRWTWPGRQTYAVMTTTCPACSRINDDYPAGEVVISGAFAQAHIEEILARVRHVAAAEIARHPLNRIINVVTRGRETLVTTTDVHLPHRIGHALRDAWGGNVLTHYDLHGYFARVRWISPD